MCSGRVLLIQQGLDTHMLIDPRELPAKLIVWNFNWALSKFQNPCWLEVGGGPRIKQAAELCKSYS